MFFQSENDPTGRTHAKNVTFSTFSDVSLDFQNFCTFDVAIEFFLLHFILYFRIKNRFSKKNMLRVLLFSMLFSFGTINRNTKNLTRNLSFFN